MSKTEVNKKLTSAVSLGATVAETKEYYIEQHLYALDVLDRVQFHHLPNIQ
ncbi:MAG: hypothetical protein KF860_10160 [Cyclobacteriaceae bacterium]|nr:hypothetical protein [Cyclobacteriaceae bacterium]